MAMAAPVKLLEARLAVAVRCGQATGNYVPANLTPIIDEKLRQAQALLWLECWWTRNLIRTVYPLVAGVSEYDVPDNVDALGIQRVAVQRTPDLRYYDLQPGIRTMERNSATTNGRPLRYTFENQAMILFPAPDANWVNYVIEGYYAPTAFIAEDADSMVDREALIAYGEILVKNHLGLKTDEEKAMFERYLDKLRCRQSDGEGFQLGGKQSWKTKPSPQNRILGTRMANVVSGPDWQPPGWG